MHKLKIGIVGSRRRNSDEDLKTLGEFLSNMFNEFSTHDITFVSGGCPKGADNFAEILAKHWDIPIIIHYPDKSQLPENPTRKDFARINFARNTLIAKDSDILIAMVSEDRTGGTEDSIRKFKKFYPNGRLELI